MANKYNLSLGFTDEQLAAIYDTGSNVIIAKPAGGSSATVAWQVFSPMESNAVSWVENYGIYTSTSGISNGATLYQHSATGPDAQDATLYTLQPNAVIAASAGGQTDSYSLLNNYDQKPYMTVGLFQGAIVNGEEILNNAISAAPVLLNSTALMTPYTTIYVWIQSQVKSNSVVTTVTSPMTELKFGAGVDTINVNYNSKTGTFI
jgi:hypothetical protein